MAFFKIAYVILFIVATLLTVVIHPTVHKPVSFESSEFNIAEFKQLEQENNSHDIQTVVTQAVQKTQPTQQYVEVRDTRVDDSANFRPKTVNVKNQTPSQSSQNVKLYNNSGNTSQTIVLNPQNTQSASKNIKVTPQTQEEQLKKFEKIMNESTKNPNKDLTADEISTVLNVLSSNNQPTNKPTTQKPSQTTSNPSSTKTVKVLTEQEEIIAWNKWRANLQNRVMTDSHVSAPLGTVFMFSCIVDKYGNISNINAWSTNPDYTAVAKRKVKPALAALQNQSILKFPEGTKRTSTVVAGSFMMATSDRFATPGDYSDYERVK